MKIAIIGNGFVGKAVANAFTCQIVIADPALNDTEASDLPWESIGPVFVCVPTPLDMDGQVDAEILRNVVDQIPRHTLIILKSTVMPDQVKLLAANRRLIYNPCFLTERNANRDFLNPDSLIFGGDPMDCGKAASLYGGFSDVKSCPIYFTDLATASLCVYALNGYLAAKVTFLNELYTLHKKTAGSTWEQFTNIIGADKRLGYSHLEVPGLDGLFGYGGKELPKDISALVKYAADRGTPMRLLEKALEINKEIRDE